MIKRVIYGVFLAFFLEMISSCATNTGYSSAAVKRNMDNGLWGSPENTTLVFAPNSYFNAFLQQNPKFGYNFYPTTKKVGTVADYLVPASDICGISFIEPLPVGSELKLFSKTTRYDLEVETIYYGVGGVDVVLNKPGLLFFNPEHKDSKKELQSLKLLYGFFKGTEWDPIIRNRMKELSNE